MGRNKGINEFIRFHARTFMTPGNQVAHDQVVDHVMKVARVTPEFRNLNLKVVKRQVTMIFNRRTQNAKGPKNARSVAVSGPSSLATSPQEGPTRAPVTTPELQPLGLLVQLDAALSMLNALRAPLVKLAQKMDELKEIVK